MLQYEFEQSVGYWLILAAQGYQKALNDELAPHGITFRQAQVLGCLALEGELSQVALASKMMIEPPTLVGILDRMQRDGWITRIDCPSDRRKKLIRATAGADGAWEKIVCCARRVRARATQGLSPADVQTLIRLLQQVQKNLSVSDMALAVSREPHPSAS